MYGHQTQLDYLKLNQESIHNEVKHQHLANRIHRANKLKQAETTIWHHALNLLHHIRSKFTFGSEEPNPEPKEAV